MLNGQLGAFYTTILLEIITNRASRLSAKLQNRDRIRQVRDRTYKFGGDRIQD
jgi:hypothetical protein